MKNSLLFLVLFFGTFGAHGSLPILQGVTNETSSQFSILSKNPNLVFSVTTQKNKTKGALQPQRTGMDERAFSDWKAYKVFFTGLKTEQTYWLEVRDQNQNLVDQREFQTLNLKKDGVRMVLASCMKDKYVDEQGPMWKSVFSSKPDLIFLLGDNVYVDSFFRKAKIETFWKRYLKSRKTLFLFHSKKLIPTLATWDDHDYGKNNSGRGFKLKGEAKDTFRAMYPQDSLIPEVDHGPGVASIFSGFGFDFLLLDNRSFRIGISPKKLGSIHQESGPRGIF